MPRVEITLNDGSKKIVEFENGFTDDDVDEVAANLNKSIKKPQPLKLENNYQQSSIPADFQADVAEDVQDAAAQYGYTGQPIEGEVEFNAQDEYKRIQNDNTLSKEQKVAEINRIAEHERNLIDKENAKTLAKLYGGAALEIGSAAIPMGAGVRLAGAGLKVAKPLASQVIKNLAKRGAIEGAGSGAVFGLGRGLMEDKNPLVTSLEDAALGGVLGAGGNALGGKLMTQYGKTGKRIADIEKRKAQRVLPKSEAAAENIVRPPTVQEAQDIKKAIKTSIKLDKLPETNKNNYYASRRHKGTFSKDLVDPLGLELENTSRKVNEGIKKLSKDPAFINSKEFQELDAEITKQIEKLPEEAQADYFKTWYNSIAKADNYSKIESEFKPQGLEQSVINAKGTPKEVKDILKNDMPQYQVLHNDDIINQATKEIKNNFDVEKSRLTTAKEFDALDYEKSRQIVKRLFDEGRFDEAIDLIEHVSENATKKGQDIQALSLWSNMTPEGAVFKAEKLLKKYNAKLPEAKRIKLTDKQIQDIRQLQNDALNAADDLTRTQGFARTAKYISELVPKNAAQKLKAYRNISLLLNPKTLGRNVIGNALFNTVDTASKALAVPFDRAIGLFTKNKTRVLPQIKELAKGGIEGTKTGFKEALEGIDTRGLGQRFDLGSGRTFQNPIMQKLETALDVGLRVPDRAQYEATFAESVANMMKAQGLEKPTQEILEQAEKEALESVFQNDTVLSNTILAGRKALNKMGTKDFGVGDLLIPYAQTPANLTQQAINYSPLGAIKGLANIAQGNQRQASLDLARSLIGSGIIGGGYALGANKMATPAQFNENYQKNKTIKANLLPLGIRPEAINGVWYAPFQPVSTNIAAGIAMANGEEPLTAGINTITDLPFLQNYNKLMSDLKEGDDWKALQNFVASVPSQFVPTALGQVASLADPYQRETYDPNVLKQGLNKAQVKLPVASSALPLKRDVTGQPIDRYESKGAAKLFDAFINPTFINKETTDPVLSELKSLYETTGETKQFMPVADKKIDIRTENGEKIKRVLTGKEYSDFQGDTGKIMYNLLNYALPNEEYQNKDEAEKIKYIQSIKKATENAVKNKRFGHELSSKGISKTERGYIDYILENYDDLAGDL